jgi:uncharacterized protein
VSIANKVSRKCTVLLVAAKPESLVAAEPESSSPARMLPQRGGHGRAFWTGGAKGQLLIERCDTCERWAHPPAGTCRECGSPLVARPVSGRATVFTYTVNTHAYNPAVPVPYVIAIVELAEQRGLRLAANIVDCEPDSVTCGMPIVARFEQHGASGQHGSFGHGAAFVPVFAPAGASISC